jgi:hypothetical protein
MVECFPALLFSPSLSGMPAISEGGKELCFVGVPPGEISKLLPRKMRQLKFRNQIIQVCV